MLKIGDFSKLAHVSIKTLHHYDELGLLKPVHIDRFSGYRYYGLEQLATLNRILDSPSNRWPSCSTTTSRPLKCAGCCA